MKTSDILMPKEEEDLIEWAICPYCNSKVKKKNYGSHISKIHGETQTNSDSRELLEGKSKQSKDKKIKLEDLLFVGVVLIIMVVGIILVNPFQDDDEESNGYPSGGQGAPDFSNFELGESDLMGFVDEKTGTYSFILKNREGTVEYNIFLNENTNVYFVDRNGITGDGSLSDIQVGLIVLVWGSENSDGSWFATDIGITPKR